MKKFLTIIILLVISLPMVAFFEAEYNGVMMKFEPLDLSTCRVYGASIIDDEEGTFLGYETCVPIITTGAIVIPSTINGYTVTEIGSGAFYHCSKLTSINIPSTVTKIEQNAFSGCSSLTSISIPSGVTLIGDGAFSGCSSLTSISIPSGVTLIGNGAFSGCSSLTSISIPSGVTLIGDGAFSGCSSLIKVNIPSSVRSIGGGAFDGCGRFEFSIEDLTAWCNLQFDEESSYIFGSSHPQLCSYYYGPYTAFSVPSGITHIDYQHFHFFSNIQKITLPETITSIDRDALPYKAIICVPDGKKASFTDMIQFNSFYTYRIYEKSEVKYLNNIYYQIDTNNLKATILDYSADDYVLSKTITLSNVSYTVNAIGDNAFRNHPDLASINLPLSIASIGNSAFSGCSLTHITIPQSVGSIGSNAFDNCSKLTSVRVCSTTPLTIDNNTFSNRTNATLYVPEGSKAAYASANIWKDFKEIVEDEVSPAITFACNTVKDICIANWDTNGDGELSMDEAAVVTDLGEVFKNNTSITSFDELQYFTGLIEIADNAFYGCTNLESIAIPSNITKIGESAFTYYNTPKMQRVNIFDLEAWCNIDFVSQSSNPLYMGNYLYLNGSKVEDLVIPNNIETLKSYVFTRGYFNSVTIPSTTSLSGLYQFMGAHINEMTVKQNVGNGSFRSATINHLVIDPSVTFVDDLAFKASNIGILEIPYSDKDLKWESGRNSDGLFEDATIETAIVDRRIFESWSGSHVESTFKNTKIKELRIGSHAIYSYDNLCTGCTITDLYFDDFTEISSDALYRSSYQNSVEHLHLPITVTNISDNAFNFSGLTSVTVEWEEPLAVPENTFYGKDMNNVTLYVPAGTKAAYEAAEVWKNFGNIEEYGSLYVETTEGAVNLRQGASTQVSVKFGCDKPLTAFQFSIQLPAGFSLSEQTLNSDMSNGHQLTVQDKGNGLYNILCSNMRDKAFKELSGELMSFTLSSTEEVELGTYQAVISGIKFVDENGESVVMADHTFNIMVSDPPINFADEAVKALCVANWDTNGDGELSMAEAAAVTELGEVFKNNEEITSFDELQYFTGLTSIGAAAFDNCHNLTSVVIPDQVTSLESCAFIGCWSLPTLVIPDGVTNIHEMAIGWCIGMNSITIPSSVTYMESQALKNNGSLASVTVEWQEPLAVPDNLFMNVALEKVVLYVPAGTKDAYKAANVWKDFGTIIEYADLVENCRMEDEPSEDWSCFWVREWRTMEEIFVGPANIVEDPADASNHCVKVVVRSEAEADAAGNKELDADGNFALFDSQFFIQSKDKIESGKRLKLTMRVRADKPAEIITEAHNMPTDYNYYGLFDNINVTPVWQKIEREVIVTPEMTQEDLDKEMHTVAFHLTTRADGNVFYFDDIRLEVMNRVNDLYAGEPGTPTEVYQGSSATVSLCLDNETTLSSFQFALKLPEGISIKKVNGKFDCALNSERTDGHSLAVTEQGEGIYAFLCSNMKDLPLKGNNGELLTITIACDEETTPDDYQAVISDIKFVDTHNEYVMLDDCTFDIAVKQLTIGDVNDNGQIDVQDLQQMVKYMLDKPMTQAFIFEAADIDNNGTINVMDVVSEVELIFNNFNAAESSIFDELGSGLSLVTSGDGAVHVSMADGQPYVASQFVVELSDGQKLAGVTTDRSHTAVIRQMTGNRFLVVCYSPDNRVFAAQEKPLTLHVTGRGNVAMDQVSFLDAKDQMVAFQNVSSGYTTGISEAEANSLKPTSIYSIGGMVVKENASSLKGLPSGVYIVNGKKHSKK